MSKKILFIDDEPEFIRPFADALEDEGYEVIRELNVDQAIKRLRKDDFDLIILDLLMPSKLEDVTEDEVTPDLRQTGVRLHREIRNTLEPNIPIIILSVVRDPEIHNQIQELEKRYNNKKLKFLTKPILPSELVVSVCEALAKKD